MKIAVCIKQVPGKFKIEIDPQSGALTKSGTDSMINPFDQNALEEALRLKEKHGGKVSAVSMGPAQAAESLREAIALGADEAILLSDPAFEGSDTWATAHVLSLGMKKLGPPDLIICGRQSLDGETGQVGPELAEMLGLPFVSSVSRIEEVGEGSMRMQRMAEEGHHVVEMQLPGAISVVKEINVPRLPSLRGLMQAKKAAITVWNGQELGADPARVGSQGSPLRTVRVTQPQRSAQREMLQGSPESQVDEVVEKLRQSRIL
ncbi:MAG: electron transfer flavoprotein subunit beta/FixA family protein [Chloroflexi bacterium]|nr:electron transfer flavoprotein subunit beta/FixA family protein [Chloroflexota bacterium]